MTCAIQRNGTVIVKEIVTIIIILCRFPFSASHLEASVVTAVDINDLANKIYQHNFPDVNLMQRNIQSLTRAEFTALDADMFLMSPPCQPFTRFVGISCFRIQSQKEVDRDFLFKKTTTTDTQNPSDACILNPIMWLGIGGALSPITLSVASIMWSPVMCSNGNVFVLNPPLMARGHPPLTCFLFCFRIPCFECTFSQQLRLWLPCLISMN